MTPLQAGLLGAGIGLSIVIGAGATMLFFAWFFRGPPP